MGLVEGHHYLHECGLDLFDGLCNMHYVGPSSSHPIVDM